MIQEYGKKSVSHLENSDGTEGICIGVSSCLLGHQVRYDGNHKYHATVAEQLCASFQCMPICPEYAIGLGVPREPIQLVQSSSCIRAKGVINRDHEVTELLQAYAEFVAHKFPKICGYVFKSRSPSCALGSAPLMTPDGKVADAVSGIYAQKLVTLLPALPVIEEASLTDHESIDRFIESVRHYSTRNK